MNEQFTEQFDARGAAVRVDRAAGVIHGVKILGLASKNGRVYRSTALWKSAPPYEGARVNVNHPHGAAERPRDYEDRIGAMRNIRTQADGLYGDFHFNPKHRLAEQLLWDAEHSPENVGFSHNVLARTSRQGEQIVVEEILRVQSVDLVADPATTQGLFESSDEGGLDVSPNMSLDAMRSAVRLLEYENRELRRQVAELADREAGRERRAAVDQQIAAAEIPAELVTEIFREQCYAADEAALARLIAARQNDARLVEAQLQEARERRLATRPRSVEQGRAQTEQPLVDAASFAAAIR